MTLVEHSQGASAPDSDRRKNEESTPFDLPATKSVIDTTLEECSIKVRLDIRGELPDEYKPNLGFDGHCCGFLEVQIPDFAGARAAGSLR